MKWKPLTIFLITLVSVSTIYIFFIDKDDVKSALGCSSKEPIDKFEKTEQVKIAEKDRPPYHLFNKEIFKDSFEDNSKRWREGSLDSVDFKVKNGSYRIVNNDWGKLHRSFKGMNIISDENYLIEATFRKVAGDGNAKYGIMWGSDEGYNNYYFFFINGDGEYNIFIRSSGEWNTIGEKSKSNAIRKYGSNKLSIVSIGNVWSFYINKYLVLKSTARRLFDNRVGFGIGAHLVIDILEINVKR